MKLWFTVICLAFLCITVSAELVAQYGSDEPQERGDRRSLSPRKKCPYDDTHHKRWSEEPEQHERHPQSRYHHHHRRDPMRQCRREFKRFCGGRHGYGQRETHWQCLIDTVDKFSNGLCKKWVQGLQACNSAAASLCASQSSSLGEAQRCLRSLDPTTIPDDCRDSNYYKYTIRPHSK